MLAPLLVATTAVATELESGREQTVRLVRPVPVHLLYWTAWVDEAGAVRERFSGGRPYLLHLGTIEPRKGIDRLIRAWERLPSLIDDPPDLVLAGAEGWGTRPILEHLDASPLREHLHRPGYVSDDDARELVAHAEAVVVASEAEGFSLPLAEAICCGTAAVASDLPVLRETGGDAALYVDTDDAEAFDQ